MPNLSKNEWKDLDRELKPILAPWHEHLAIATSQNISEINDFITQDIRTFLISKPDLFLEQRPSHTTVQNLASSPGSHVPFCSLGISRKLQKEADRPGATPEARHEWRACIKAIQHLKQRHENIQQSKFPYSLLFILKMHFG